MVRRSVADDSYGRGSFAWTVKLREIDSLPRAERDCAVAHWKGQRAPDEHRLDVRRPVAFSVRVLRVARDRSVERIEEILPDIRVRILVHEDRGSRVRDADGHDPVADLRACDRGLHARGDIDRLLAFRCDDGDLFVPNRHARTASWSRCAAIRAMSAAVALPPLTTRTVRRPRGSTFPARTAASGAAPDGSTRSDRDSRYS